MGETTIETNTDFNGYFELKVKMNDTLTFKQVEYNSKEITITKDSQYYLTLKMDLDVQYDLFVVGLVATDSDYIHRKTPEEIKEEERIETIRKQNRKVFYKRLFKKRLETQRARRKQIKNGKIERTKIGKLLYVATNIFRKRK